MWSLLVCTAHLSTGLRCSPVATKRLYYLPLRDSPCSSPLTFSSTASGDNENEVVFENVRGVAGKSYEVASCSSSMTVDDILQSDSASSVNAHKVNGLKVPGSDRSSGGLISNIAVNGDNLRSHKKCSSLGPARRYAHSAQSHSPLFSSALQDVDVGRREIKKEVPGVGDQPINLFHSVLCGSYCTVCSTECPLSDDEGETVKEKAPIIVLHGLLGSARNFQSWMKLVQQREIELDKEDAEKRALEVRH